MRSRSIRLAACSHSRLLLLDLLHSAGTQTTTASAGSSIDLFGSAHREMRTCAVAFAALLLLLLLATRAHGIRLDRQLHEAINSKEMADPKSGAGEASIADDSVEKHRTPDGRCSGAKVKKTPLVHAEETAEAKPQQQQVSSTGNGHTTAVDDAEAAEAMSQQPRVARQRQQTYPDLMDIAGMDYSPATRKPPIHN